MSFLSDIATGIGSIASGFLGSQSQAPQETKIQRKQRKLIDSLLSSLSGTGPYSDLYRADDEAFQRSFVQPAQNMFRNQIAPQIQQQYIASGQQRGTALDDQLLRAGVDLDSLLNQQYMNFQQGAQNRMQNAINSILSQGAGAPQAPTSGQNLMGALSGYMSSPAFGQSVGNLFQGYSTAPQGSYQRRGFAPDNFEYQNTYQPHWNFPSPF